jgi:RND family efflux transporter MFP subunit
MNFFHPMLILAGLAILSAAVSGCAPAPAATAASDTQAHGAAGVTVARVTAAAPQRKKLQLFTTQSGRIEAYEEAPLFPRVSGYVAEVRVDIGDCINKDDVLLVISAPELDNDVAQKRALLRQAEANVRQAEAAVVAARATVASARARVSQAESGAARAESEYLRSKSEHARIAQLADEGSITRKALDESLHELQSADAGRQEIKANVEAAQAMFDEAEANVVKATADAEAVKARVAVAEANLATAETMQGYTQIVAPFAGVVTRRNVDMGHFVSPGNGSSAQPLLVVACIDKVRVFVDVPEMEAPLVTSGTEGDEATLQVQSLPARQFAARVARTAWSLSSSNRSLGTEIDLPNEDAALRPGMYATVSILLDERENALVLPITALVRDGDATMCCCVVDGKIDRRKIDIGLRVGSEAEIVGGLQDSDIVVLVQSQSLQQNQPVEILPPAEDTK